MVWQAERQDLARLRAMLPDVAELRSQLVPDAAMAAGAADNENYTDEMLLRRAALRSDKTVLKALEYAWVACSGMDIVRADAGGEPSTARVDAASHARARRCSPRAHPPAGFSGFESASVQVHDGIMSFDEYTSVSRRIYLVLRIEETADESKRLSYVNAMRKTELDVDPHDCMDTIDDDFAEDSKGKDVRARD